MSDAKREIRTIRRPACFLCGSEGKVRYTNLVDRLFNAPGTWVLKECCGPACGLLWLDPTPLSEDLPLAYQKYFTHEPGKRASQSGRIRGLLYQGYQVASTVPATLTGLQKAKNHLRQMFLTDLKPGRLLDVGCGDGVFLDRMRKEGWAVDGVDFDEHAIENAKLKYGLKLWHGDLHSAHFQADSFDAITLSHVIEHVTNPGELMVELKRILKPGGRVVLTTPNSAGLGHRKFQSYWWGLDPPRHLQVFNLIALHRLAEQTGFGEIHTFSTAANADIFIGGSYSIRDSSDQRIDYKPPPNLRRTLGAVFGQYNEHRILAKDPAVGEEAVLICEKKSP